MISHDGEWDEDGPRWGPILDAAPILISILDADYRIVKANATLKAVLRKASSRVIGRKCYEVIHGTRQPPSYCPHSRALKTRTHQEEEFFEPHLGIRIAASCHPLVGADGKVTGSIYLATDVKAPILSDAVVTNNLSDRQQQILKLLCTGQRTKTIAAQLSISPRTVEYHRRRMMKMFHAGSPAELIARALSREPFPAE